MMSMRGFSRVLVILDLLALICQICLFRGWICRGQDEPKIWHLLEIVRLGEIAFRGRYHRLGGAK